MDCRASDTPVSQSGNYSMETDHRSSISISQYSKAAAPGMRVADKTYGLPIPLGLLGNRSSWCHVERLDIDGGIYCSALKTLVSEAFYSFHGVSSLVPACPHNAQCWLSESRNPGHGPTIAKSRSITLRTMRHKIGTERPAPWTMSERPAM